MSDSPDHSEDRVTVWMSADVRERMDSNYVDWRYESRSQWVREAVESRMVLEDALDAFGLDLPETADEREAMIKTIVENGIDASANGLVEADEE